MLLDNCDDDCFIVRSGSLHASNEVISLISLINKDHAQAVARCGVCENSCKTRHRQWREAGARLFLF